MLATNWAVTFLYSHTYSAYNLTFGCLQKQELTFACPGGQKAKPSFEDTKQETIRKAILIFGRKRINNQFGLATSLLLQWLRLRGPNAGSLVGELDPTRCNEEQGSPVPQLIPSMAK